MAGKIGFIGGGNMAEGIIGGLLGTKTKAPSEILVKEVLPERAAYLKETYQLVTVDSYEAVTEADILVIAVRPQDAKKVSEELRPFVDAKRHSVVSICAGIKIEQFAQWIGAGVRYARIMPNTVIQVKRGYSALAFGEGFTGEEKAEVQKITDAIGKTLLLAEGQFDAFTATSCAGPEWLILFATALVDGAVETGLSRKDAAAIVYENLIATGLMLSSTKKHPIQITDEMNTPGGIGIAGFHAFQDGGLHGTTMTAVNAAYQRTTELGK